MKLRRLAEDFQVDEQCSLPIGHQGEYAVYRLHKKHWTTLDALDRFARMLKVPRRNINHAGLKDRHAETTQLITVRRGPSQSFEDESLLWEYLGQSRREICSDDISANIFRVVLRSLSAEEIGSALQTLPHLQASGLPNYFDDQRFGSYFPGLGFLAEPWIRGDYEEAFRRAFVEPEPGDAPEEKEQKRLLRENWGDWLTCKQLLDRSHRRSIVTYLADKPGDFKGAWGRVNSDLRGLALSALQSDLWNQIVSQLLQSRCDPSQLIPITLKTGPVFFPHQLRPEQLEEFQRLQIPLPSARLELQPGPLKEWIDRGLATRGWKLEELKVRYPRDRFFSRSERAVLIPVNDLKWKAGEDELDPSLQKLTLQFTLPRGSYATMLVKRLIPTV